MALGAERRQVARMIVSQAMTLAGVGVTLGVAAAYAVSRVMTSLLYEVTPTDPAIFLVGDRGARRDDAGGVRRPGAQSRARRSDDRAAMRVTPRRAHCAAGVTLRA